MQRRGVKVIVVSPDCREIAGRLGKGSVPIAVDSSGSTFEDIFLKTRPDVCTMFEEQTSVVVENKQYFTLEAPPIPFLLVPVRGGSAEFR